MTDEPLPMEYIMTGLRAVAMASRRMSIDSESRICWVLIYPI